MAWIKRHRFNDGDKHHSHGGVYLWTDPKGSKTYGGQSSDIEARWRSHWDDENQTQRFHRECKVKHGVAGVMMRDDGHHYVIWSIAESILNLALGLGSEKVTPQKRVLQVCEPRLSAGMQLLTQLTLREGSRSSATPICNERFCGLGNTVYAKDDDDQQEIRPPEGGSMSFSYLLSSPEDRGQL